MENKRSFTGPKPVPVCVYLIFHPKSEEARRLADRVFDWLRLDGGSTIAGLPVYYRAHVENGVIAPAIEFKDATHNFLVPLIDDHLAIDPVWREALETLVDKKAPLPKGVRKHVLPVMVDKSFNQLAFLAVPFNPVRIFAVDDPPVPPAGLSGTALDEAWEPRVGARGARLRRRLTESMVRLMRSVNDDDQVPRLKVFVSHAKADGEVIARCIRDELASVSQLEAWFDVNDLSAGRSADGAMSTAAALSSGGMIAVITSAYATRPWCRHEARQARRPVRVGRGAALVMFVVQPTVAVQGAMPQWARAVGPLAQVHRIGWSPADSTPQVAELVDRLLLEILLADTNRQLIANLPKGDIKGRVFLNFVPDAWSLAEIRAQTDKANLGKQIVYPGHRLGRAEDQELRNVVTAVFGPKASLQALESLALPAPDRKRSLRVALSAGGEFDDLYKAGVGPKHVDDLMVRLSRTLLEAGHRVSYGGTLTHAGNLTVSLLAAGEGWRADRAFELDEPGGKGARKQREALRIRKQQEELNKPPIRNYAGWPHSEEITTSKRAEHLGLCEFIQIYPDGTSTASPANLERWKANSTRDEAVAMRAMRERMAADNDIRVLFAGKIHGASGWLPGIAEELVTTLKADKPYLILGGFGGCASLLAEFLLDPDKEWPRALTFEGERERRERSRQPKDAEWLHNVSAEARRSHYEELHDLVHREREAMGADSRTPGGLRLDAWRSAARSQSSATATIAMVLKIVEQLQARAP